MLSTIIKEIIDTSKIDGKRITQNDLASVLGMTKQGFSNKMQRDTFTVEDLIKLANYLQMKVVIKGDREFILNK